MLDRCINWIIRTQRETWRRRISNANSFLQWPQELQHGGGTIKTYNLHKRNHVVRNHMATRTKTDTFHLQSDTSSIAKLLWRQHHSLTTRNWAFHDDKHRKIDKQTTFVSHLIWTVGKMNWNADWLWVIVRIPQDNGQDLKTWRSKLTRTVTQCTFQSALTKHCVLARFSPGWRQQTQLN